MTCAVVLPIHKTDLNETEMNSIFFNLNTLKDWDHIVVCPISILDEVKVIFTKSKCKKIKFYGLKDSNFHSVTSYDQMLIKSEFYKMFQEYLYILITQPDVVIFRDEIQYWMDKNFDYIGAPWIINSSKNKENYFVGNGGVSLRKIDSFLNALLTIKVVKCPKWYLKEKKIPKLFHGIFSYCFGFNRLLFFKQTHEDFFWSQLIPSSNKTFKVAPLEDSFEFAIEKFKEEDRKKVSIKNMPFAIHAWEKYAPTNLITDIKKIISI